MSAALPHTIDAGEYMVANSVMPTVGPARRLVGVGLGTTLRVVLGNQMPDYQANAMLFALAGLGWLISMALALRIPRNAAGSGRAGPGGGPRRRRGLVEALAHLSSAGRPDSA